MALVGPLAACSSAGSSGSVTAGDHLTIGLQAAVPCLDPDCATSSYTLPVKKQLYLALTEVTPSGDLTGQAAESWANPTPTTWTFTLRSGLVFANGDPLDATAVKAAYERLLADAAAGGNDDLRKAIKSIDVVNATTVTFNLATPNVEFARRQARVTIVDVKWINAGGNPATSANASGPYELVSYNPQSEVVLRANPKYYGAAPKFTDVTYRFLTTSAARLSAIKSHEVDITDGVDPQDLARLQSDKSLTSGAVNSDRSVLLGFNTNLKPLSDERVRQALNYAVDTKSIIASIYRGLVTPLNGQVLSPLYPGYNADLAAYGYDPAKAKSLLAQAGYANGFSMTIEYATGSFAGIDLAAQAIQQQLGQVGVQVKLAPVPVATWAADWNKKDSTVDASLVGYTTGGSTSQLLSAFTSASPAGHAPDPAFDSLIAKASAATTEGDFKSVINSAMDEMREFAPAIFLWSSPETYAYYATVKTTVRGDGMLLAYAMEPAAGS